MAWGGPGGTLEDFVLHPKGGEDGRLLDGFCSRSQEERAGRPRSEREAPGCGPGPAPEPAFPCQVRSLEAHMYPEKLKVIAQQVQLQQQQEQVRLLHQEKLEREQQHLRTQVSRRDCVAGAGQCFWVSQRPKRVGDPGPKS